MSNDVPTVFRCTIHGGFVSVKYRQYMRFEGSEIDMEVCEACLAQMKDADDEQELARKRRESAGRHSGLPGE